VEQRLAAVQPDLPEPELARVVEQRASWLLGMKSRPYRQPMHRWLQYAVIAMSSCRACGRTTTGR